MSGTETGNSNEKRAGHWGPRQPPNLDPNHEWAALRRRYEWNDSYDEGVAPRDELLEAELFGEDNHVHTGINFTKYDSIKVSVKGKNIKPISTFEEANLHPAMKENVRLARYQVPTPVQTAAFLIPILSKLFGKAKKLAAPRPAPGTRRYKAEPLVLILAPTRELATQIFDECRRFTYRSMMRPCVVYGGAETTPQKNELAKGCDVLTATPGRLADFLERGLISLRRVKFLVLDEADRMLDMGFEKKIREIVQKSDFSKIDILDDGTRQTLMFSATFPKSIRSLARDFLANSYVFLTVGRVGGTTSDITQKIMYVEDHKKRDSLVALLLKQPPSRTLVFVKSKRGADSLDDFLYSQNFPTTSIHGDRTQQEREDALISFKNGRCPILIATAVAARGLDIKNVMHVINYDLCDDIDEYVHRIGRTARVGNQGLATTFYNNGDSAIAGDLVRILLECKQEVPDFLKEHAGNVELRFDEEEDDDDEQGNNQSNSGFDGNTQKSSGYSSWDNNQKPWDKGGQRQWDNSGQKQWNNNDQGQRNNNNQRHWDNNNQQSWGNQQQDSTWGDNQNQSLKPQSQTTSSTVASNDNWPNPPTAQPTYQYQSMPYTQPNQTQYATSTYNQPIPSQSPYVGAQQPIVNLPRSNSNNNDDGSPSRPRSKSPKQQRNQRRTRNNGNWQQDDSTGNRNTNQTSSDGWGNDATRDAPKKDWDPNNVPWQ
ncbi:2655_t:CDS:10 [Cetraspora pellucida]|uniref:RNA helicase n=1 Tax=Cetraspora pellucida TaxID=1433469 RepID=A0A9N9B9T3_9GLOM|nr:2655_t:CDS:10 [Cetraspora pellucida]